MARPGEGRGRLASGVAWRTQSAQEYLSVLEGSRPKIALIGAVAMRAGSRTSASKQPDGVRKWNGSGYASEHVSRATEMPRNGSMPTKPAKPSADTSSGLPTKTTSDCRFALLSSIASSSSKSVEYSLAGSALEGCRR